MVCIFMMKLGVWGETPFSVHCVGSATKGEKEGLTDKLTGADRHLLVGFKVVNWFHNHVDCCRICDGIDDFL